MPNRLIKESVCTSDNLDSLSWFEECFFYRLIVHCDDFGRMDARPAILKGKLFPLKNVTLTQISRALDSLRSAAIIDIYQVDGRSFLQMRKWDKHQQIRAKKSKFPSPNSVCNQLISNDINCNQMISDDSKCSRNPIQSNTNPNILSNESNTRTRAKKTFGSYKNVKLTDEEYKTLVDEHSDTMEAIEFLSEYIERKGYKARNHYLTLKSWVFDAVNERRMRKAVKATEEAEKGSFDEDDFFEAALKRSYGDE